MTAISPKVVMRGLRRNPAHRLLTPRARKFARAHASSFMSDAKPCRIETSHEAHAHRRHQRSSALRYRRPLRPRRPTRASPRARARARRLRVSQRRRTPRRRARRSATKLGVQAFKDKYGTNANKANAFGKCVSGTVKKADELRPTTGREERGEDVQGGAREARRSQDFKDKYGTNANKANAFGKCVSKLAKAHGSTS